MLELLSVTARAKQLQYPFVSAKHYGSTGNNAKHVGNQSTVQSGHALLFPYKLEALG